MRNFLRILNIPKTFPKVFIFESHLEAIFRTLFSDYFSTRNEFDGINKFFLNEGPCKDSYSIRYGWIARDIVKDWDGNHKGDYNGFFGEILRRLSL